MDCDPYRVIAYVRPGDGARDLCGDPWCLHVTSDIET